MDDSTIQFIQDTTGPLPLVITDPPYGGIVSEYWDRQDDVSLAAFLKQFTHAYAKLMVPGGAIYVWGGIGAPGNRAFFRYLLDAEKPGELVRKGQQEEYNYLYSVATGTWYVSTDNEPFEPLEKALEENAQ